MKSMYTLAAMLLATASSGAMETPSLFEKSADYIAARLQKPEILNNFLKNPALASNLFPKEIEEYIAHNLNLENLLAKISPLKVKKSFNIEMVESANAAPINAQNGATGSQAVQKSSNKPQSPCINTANIRPDIQCPESDKPVCGCDA